MKKKKIINSESNVHNTRFFTHIKERWSKIINKLYGIKMISGGKKANANICLKDASQRNKNRSFILKIVYSTHTLFKN